MRVDAVRGKGGGEGGGLHACWLAGTIHGMLLHPSCVCTQAKVLRKSLIRTCGSEHVTPTCCPLDLGTIDIVVLIASCGERAVALHKFFSFFFLFFSFAKILHRRGMPVLIDWLAYQ